MAVCDLKKFTLHNENPLTSQHLLSMFKKEMGNTFKIGCQGIRHTVGLVFKRKLTGLYCHFYYYAITPPSSMLFQHVSNFAVLPKTRMSLLPACGRLLLGKEDTDPLTHQNCNH